MLSITEPFLKITFCFEKVHPKHKAPVAMATHLITREIKEASSPTMRGHFGCIFKATEEYTTGVWWAFYIRIMGT
jgi:hypothetical protein